ncbi:MAG TPA: hypothetical protein VM489_11855 [Burkholderiales bacterium]|nr:hypothetical protein [Burkholderiales bacterium]
MPDHEQRLKNAVADFERLLTAVTELVRAKNGNPGLLRAYDDACEHIIRDLRSDGIPDEQVQTIHKAMARLRLAFEERDR